MTEVTISCPQTGRPISTGLSMEETQNGALSCVAVGCPHCGDLHTWSPDDTVGGEGARASTISLG